MARKSARKGKKKSKTSGRFFYTGIRVKDMKESLDFYTNILGMRIARRGRMEHGGEYVGLRSPRMQGELELNYYPPGTRYFTEYGPGEEMDHLAFIVSDVHGAFREMRKKGVKAAIPPSKSQGTEVYVKDPNGIWIELLH